MSLCGIPPTIIVVIKQQPATTSRNVRPESAVFDLVYARGFIDIVRGTRRLRLKHIRSMIMLMMVMTGDNELK